jgi:hypothetical protein
MVQVKQQHATLLPLTWVVCLTLAAAAIAL